MALLNKGAKQQTKYILLQVTNPILILAFIPIFDYGVYPVLSKSSVYKNIDDLMFGIQF